MILLDTNVLSELMKYQPDENVDNWINSQSTHTLFISTVTMAEIELGIALLPNGRRKSELASSAQQMFTLFDNQIVSFNQPAAQRYATLVAERIAIGRPITVEDAQIAAIALANGLRLATRNIKHFQDTKRLQIINPWE